MENKYYTPTIEEFHVGFEYEVSDLSDNGKDWTWRKQVFDGEETRTYFIDELNKKEIRVKHLDREDIESLGWVFQKQHPGTEHCEFEREYNFLEVDFNFRNSIWLRIYDQDDDGDETNAFSGEIKNKSELKRLMKQLKIE